MSKNIISEISNRSTFFHLLEHNTGLIIIKLGAEWCGPCKIIEKEVNEFFASSPNEVICADIDVDICFDLYSFLKSKKMVNGIPSILCYKKGNTTFIPDDSVSGANKDALCNFFRRCNTHLKNALIYNP